MYRRMTAHWLRKAVSVLLATAMCCIAAGCDKNDSLPAEDPSDASQSVPESETDISAEQSSAPTEFDIEDAVKNITVFGSKISLPCTITDFGEDFSLDEEGYLAVFDDVASCGILYKGKTIGCVSMIDYTDGDDLNDKLIVSIDFGFIETYLDTNEALKEKYYESHNMYYGLIEVDFGGFTFESTEAEVESVFGEAYKRDDDSVRYELSFDDRRIVAEIVFHQGKVKRIIILSRPAA